jgi:hypothetical protein
MLSECYLYLIAMSLISSTIYRYLLLITIHYYPLLYTNILLPYYYNHVINMSTLNFRRFYTLCRGTEKGERSRSLWYDPRLSAHPAGSRRDGCSHWNYAWRGRDLNITVSVGGEGFRIQICVLMRSYHLPAEIRCMFAYAMPTSQSRTITVSNSECCLNLNLSSTLC